MQFERFYLGVVAWLALALMIVESSSLDHDISTKLAEMTEQMSKLSDQLSTLSEQQQQQSGQLSTLSEQQQEQSDQLSKLTEQQDKQSGQLSKLTEQQDKLAEQQFRQSGELSKLTNQMAESSNGPVFIRWGRKTCNGTGSDIIYTGVAAGSGTVDSGGGADLLCLPRDPSYANHDEVNRAGSAIYVAEYKLDPASNFPFENNDPLLLDEDVPCAVCQVTNGSSVMMIPARAECYSGWKLEYRGYLMTEDWQNHRLQYVCVDANPEVDYGGGGSAQLSVHLYVAETYCNYLPCPPFEHLAEVACVVCSK